jgi:methylmalonyl-CoA epimerase
LITGIDHVAIAVRDLDKALALWRDRFGFTFQGIEELPDQKVRVAVLTLGPFRVELVTPAADDSPLSGFLERRGEGLHHLALATADIDAALDALDAAGLPLIDRHARDGADERRIAFLHPKGTGGVLVELTQPPSGEHPDES